MNISGELSILLKKKNKSMIAGNILFLMLINGM
jgi:hypothetical protein